MNNTNPIKSQIQKQLGTRSKFPEGHVLAVAYFYHNGPHNHTQPSGHPLLIGTGIFDASVETPLNAVMRAAYKRGEMPNADNWELALEEDVIQPAHGNPIPYHKLFVFRFLPEWDRHEGLNVPNVFADCHYITKGTVVDQASANSLHSVQPKKENE